MTGFKNAPSVTDKPTITELRSDERTLRLAIAAALESGPWKHGMVRVWGTPAAYLCWKCYLESPTNEDNQTPLCPTPDAFTGPLEVAVERLVKKCQPEALRDAVLALGNTFRPDVGIDEPEWLLWWLFETSEEDKCICCLLALGQVREDER